MGETHSPQASISRLTASFYTHFPSLSALSPHHPLASTRDRYGEALQFLYDRINYEKTVSANRRYPFRLRRMRWLANRLGLSAWTVDGTAPHSPSIPIVHLAGTKGKGSTATLVSAALTESGHRTGTYTSPHLHRLEERFRIDEVPCSQEQLAELVDCMRPICNECEIDLVTGESDEPIGQPTFFELTTAMALLHFQRQGCDALVIEVGLGGRLDSTNVLAFSVTAITSIGLDHQHVLGNSASEIAREKAGIIKVGVPVISGVIETEPCRVIERVAKQRSAQLLNRESAFSVTHQQLAVGWGSTFTFQAKSEPLNEITDVHLSLEGSHQVDNAAVAIAILQTLNDQGRLSINEAAIRKAFANVSIPARIEKYLLDDGVLAIVDAAHNKDSVAALLQSLAARTPRHLPTVFVFGTSIDKDAQSMLQQIIPQSEALILTRFHGNPRFTPTAELWPIAQASNERIEREILIEEDPVSACREARKRLPQGGRLVVCGSFFLAAEVREYFENSQ